MGTRKQRERQEDFWVAHTEIASAPSHPFYRRLNQLLEGEKFDEFVEGLCAKFYARKYGRPSLTPGIYFRSLLIGYFEGIDSERGSLGVWQTHWRCGSLWPSGWTRARRITPRFRGVDG